MGLFYCGSFKLVWRQIRLAIVGPQRRWLIDGAGHRTVGCRLVVWHWRDELVRVFQGLSDPLHVDVREGHNLVRSATAVVRRVDTLQVVRSAGVGTSQRTTDVHVAGIGRWTTADVRFRGESVVLELALAVGL